MKFTLDNAPRLEVLKERRRHCVCKYCGHELEIKQIVFSELDDARTELFCPNCQKLDYGVEKIIYDNAKYYIAENRFNMFPDLDDNQMSQRMTIAKTAEIMTWICQHTEVLTDTGFTIPVDEVEAVPQNQLDLTAAEVDALSDEDLVIEDVAKQKVDEEDLDGTLTVDAATATIQNEPKKN